jgi:hypothetical protein
MNNLLIMQSTPWLIEGSGGVDQEDSRRRLPHEYEPNPTARYIDDEDFGGSGDHVNVVEGSGGDFHIAEADAEHKWRTWPAFNETLVESVNPTTRKPTVFGLPINAVDTTQRCKQSQLNTFKYDSISAPLLTTRKSVTDEKNVNAQVSYTHPDDRPDTKASSANHIFIHFLLYLLLIVCTLNWI